MMTMTESYCLCQIFNFKTILPKSLAFPCELYLVWCFLKNRLCYQYCQKDKTLLLPWNWKYRPSENFEIRLSRKHFSEELLISYKNYYFSFQFPAIKTFSSQTFFVPLLITKTSATIFTKYLLRKLHMSGSCFQVQKETGVRYILIT